jgi:hypothetical protein
MVSGNLAMSDRRVPAPMRSDRSMSRGRKIKSASPIRSVSLLGAAQCKPREQLCPLATRKDTADVAISAAWRCGSAAARTPSR